MKTKIVEKYSEIARFLEEIENFGEKKVPNHLKALQDFVSYRKVEELKSIYAELKEKHIERRLFLETVVMAGTSPCIMFAKELIISNELTAMEIAEMMITLPHYIKTPTNKLIEELFEILKLPVVTSNLHLKANSHLAFSTIVRTACFPDPVPTTVFPKICSGKCVTPRTQRSLSSTFLTL